MWFRRDSTDTTQFRRAVWDIGRWIILGPVIGGLCVLVFALLIGVSRENLINAMVWGAAFGMMSGVASAGTKWMSYWKV